MGLDDRTHEVIGTTFAPATAKKGGEDLESWLLRSLIPRIDFRFRSLEIDGEQVVVLEIPRASSKPVQFQGQEYIRIGSHRQKLKDHPEKERELWRISDRVAFEELRAAERLTSAEVLSIIDYPAYFELLKLPLPDGAEKIVQRLVEDRMVQANASGSWDITNLGAILFAKDLDAFKGLKQKGCACHFLRWQRAPRNAAGTPGQKGLCRWI